MTTQPKPQSEPRQTNQNHHGPFYRSAELVAAVHRAEGEIFETFRAAMATKFYLPNGTVTDLIAIITGNRKQELLVSR